MTQESILISTMGGQPQVVTFALDDLLGRGETISEALVVHLAPQDPRLQRALACLAVEFAGDRYRGRPCRFRHLSIRDGAEPVASIEHEGAAEAAWQTLYQLVAELKATRRRLHLCLAGGPRIIGLMAMSAATLYFDHDDRLWHMYTPQPFLERARDGAIMHAGPADGVRLVQVPLAPWGAYFPALRSLLGATADQVITAQTRWLDRTERGRCQAVIDRLTPRQVEVLQAFAAGLTPQEVAERLVVTLKTVDAHKSVILAEGRVAWGLAEAEWLTYHFLRDKFRRYFESVGSA